MTTSSSNARTIPPALLQVLACPACPARPPVSVTADGAYLACTVCGRRYPIMPNGVPSLLVEEALPPA